MNSHYTNKLVPETTDNCTLLGKRIGKIFYCCKIKKCKEPKIILDKPETQIITNSKQLICKEINLCFCNKEINMNKNSKKVNEFINRENKKNILNTNENNKNKKNNNIIKSSKFEKHQKNTKKNSLIRPVLIGENLKEKNNLKKNENILNPININIKNSFKANSIVNYISD